MVRQREEHHGPGMGLGEVLVGPALRSPQPGAVKETRSWWQEGLWWPSFLEGTVTRSYSLEVTGRETGFLSLLPTDRPLRATAVTSQGHLAQDSHVLVLSLPSLASRSWLSCSMDMARGVIGSPWSCGGTSAPGLSPMTTVRLSQPFVILTKE